MGIFGFGKRRQAIRWVEQAIDTFGYDLEGCWCDGLSVEKQKETKKALEWLVGKKLSDLPSALTREEGD